MLQKDLCIFVALFCVLLWLFTRWRHRRHILLCTKFPTAWRHVITGFGMILSSKGTIRKMNAVITKYGKNVIAYVGPFPVFFTIDPEVIKDVLNSKNCTSKPDLFYGRLSNAFGRGYVSISEPHWSNERKIVNAAFSNKNLMSFIPIFNEEVDRLLQNIDKDIDENPNSPPIEHFREFTIRISTRTTIGRNIDKTTISSKTISYNMKQLSIYAAEMTFNNIYIVKFIRQFAHMTYFRKAKAMMEGINSLINESLHGFPTKRGVDPSYETTITSAIEYMAKGVEQNRMQREHVASDLTHIFFAAFETSSSTLYFMLILLGMHPEYQQKAYEEVCNILPDDDDEQYEVTYEDINQMVYLDMVMNETMRLLPLIPAVAREVVDQDLTLSNGVVLPKGECVLINIFRLHRSKEIWGPEADKFNPDNFLPTNFDSKHPYSFIPFTKGQRFCIGWRYAQLNIKLAVSKLIKRYKFTTNCKLDDLHLENHIVSQLREEPQVILERRKKPKSL